MHDKGVLWRSVMHPVIHGMYVLWYLSDGDDGSRGHVGRFRKVL